MTTESTDLAPRRHHALKAIFWGGLAAATWDIVFAFVYYGLNGATKIGILQSVAGGLLGGAAAHAGGTATATLGAICHYTVGFGAAAVYVAASRWLPVLVKHAIPNGLLFGVAVYFFMNMVVLPLSAYHSHASAVSLVPWPILAHAVGVGLPIALAARRFSR